MANYPCTKNGNLHSSYNDDFKFVKWAYEKYEQMSLQFTFVTVSQGLPKGQVIILLTSNVDITKSREVNFLFIIELSLFLIGD